jgi:hypothetical protein
MLLPVSEKLEEQDCVTDGDTLMGITRCDKRVQLPTRFKFNLIIKGNMAFHT